MKIFSAILAVYLTAFLAAALAEGPQKENLKIIYNLSGNLQTLENKELVVTFSDDMVPLGGKRDGNTVIQIKPMVKGEFFWRGNRSLAFKPKGRFRYSTTYTATIPAGTRSLAGKTLAQAVQWQWSTPLAIPIEIKTTGHDYFLPLSANEKLDYKIWVKDAIFLRFNQPVTAASAKDFIVLKEIKSNEPAAIRAFQKAADQIEFRPGQDLKRGMAYQFIVKKGFCGSEGRSGTIKDFTFTFATIPSFKYTGVRPLITFPDSAYCRLLFSNPLAEFNKDKITISKIAGKGKKPLAFGIEPQNYDPASLLLHIDEELVSGDMLTILVDRSLTNIYKEKLPEKLALEARVCSSRWPRLDVVMQEKKLSLTVKSMKKVAVRLFTFRPDFYSQLQKLDSGILQKNNFKDEFIEKEIFRELENLPEKENSFAPPDNEPGSSLGFFGVLVNRYEPYNACQDISLLRLPLALPPDLQVFHRRNMDMVVKASHGQTLYWLYDNRSGKGLGSKPFFVKPYGNETLAIGETTANGVLLSDKGISASDLIVAKNANAGDMALARIDYNPEAGREIRVTVFSDRDFYRPGDTVHINGIVKEHAAGKISSPQLKTALLEISGPDRQQVKTDTLQLDHWGGFHYEFKSDPAGKKGLYQIKIRQQNWQDWQSRHSVTIDYYQPNTIGVAVTNMAKHYLFLDTFSPEVSGSYLAGNPMAGDAFNYTLALSPLDRSVFTANGLERYGFGLASELARSDPPKKGDGKLDANGKYTVGISMTKFKETNFLADLGFFATGKSAEGKEFTARARSIFFPGNLLTGICVGYYQNLKDPIKAELAMIDFSGKPTAAKISVSLYREYYDGSRHQLKKVTGPDDISLDKTKTHTFRVSEPGHYVLRCDTPDTNGRVISTSGRFFAWDSNYSIGTDRLRIESDQWTLHTGETLKCFIHSPRKGQALVTIERGKVLDSMVIELENMTLLEIPIRKEYFPAIRVNVIAMFGNNVSEEVSRDFTVKDQGKTLRIDLESPGEIKPASKTQLKIKVSDDQKKGVKAKLFVYAVDEGNLSLQGYKTPDPHDYFYYSAPLGRNLIRTYYSKNYTHWTFKNPMLDIALTEPAIFGCIFKPDATPIAGAMVTLEDENHKKIKSTSTSTQGFYSFFGISNGHYAIKAEARGFHPFRQSDIYFDGTNHSPCDLALIPAGLPLKNQGNEAGIEDGVGGGIDGAMEMAAPIMPMAAEAKSMARMKGADGVLGGVEGETWYIDGANVDIAGIRVRSDFREVLFCKTVETDESGNATIDFESSDQLSTFRIMAVAYNEDSFGKTEKDILVSKDLLISETMPEFARQNDEFKAGVQLSNRTARKLAVTLLAKPEGIRINGSPQLERSLDPRANSLFQFPFLADRVGAAKVEFYAVSAADKDGLEKKFLVSDCLTTETLLDFASGKSVLKKIQPQAEAENQTVTIKVAPSLLKPAVNIAKKLVFYPYECLEQRSSKVMPFLALSPQLAERLELGLDPQQVRTAVAGYLKIIPEFMTSQGALAYYRGGQYTSDYLTAYVLWSLQLAKARDYPVDPQLLKKLTAYLQQASLDKTTACFYQFVLSLGKNADSKKLEKLAAERESLSLPARVFLYRALNNQHSGNKLLPTMVAEFNNSLQIEADFAYFDVREFSYDRDFPFYSSRFVTAILLQAILEVEHEYVLAEKIINWLLEGEPYCWNTTQTNFWILFAMDEYLRQVEKTTARKAEISMLGETSAKEFLNSRDVMQVSKKLAGRKDMVEVKVNADQPVYVTSELTFQLANAAQKSRGIDIQRLVYDEKGRPVDSCQRGRIYQVELLLKADKEVPYGVIDEPLAAGFELLRQDIASTRTLQEFNSRNSRAYHLPWLRQENAADRLVFYTYAMQGNVRIVYFIKAIYSGRFTWLPASAQGMYHPQYFGRSATRTIVISE